MDAKMKVERAAAGAAIDGVLKYVNHGDDRTKALLNLTDFVQKFTGNMFAEKTSTISAPCCRIRTTNGYSMSTADWTSWIRR